MEKKITKTDLFPNPLFMIEDLIDDTVRLQLIKDCYSWKESSPGRQVSNFGGWHSDNLLFKREENLFKFQNSPTGTSKSPLKSPTNLNVLTVD